MPANPKEEEIEIKFHIQDPKAIKEKLKKIGAEVSKARVFESNLRFDYPDRILSANKQVLRLRKDSENTITYKGPAQIDQPVSVREEIEITVDDFERAKHLLEALGYEVFMTYEKYRTTYSYKNTTIVVDELPIGDFIEIEGLNPFSIEHAAQDLNLEWTSRIPASYMYIFEQLKQKRPEMQAKQLTFADLSAFEFDLELIGISPADAD